ncbi:fibrinogen C domain-containing protein 1-like [Biomphalaria glabrata]|uniref:Fibrinogen C domain-containing protein 1-like n=1 Tax=Biomphalaria glabrata TaxID=6526 RepID=A0A9W2YU52_BIOGL|nr:fibrinogen C domain-containing protein 1-like [Biomphalaria glabrata]
MRLYSVQIMTCLLTLTGAIPNGPGPAGRMCHVPEAGECVKGMKPRSHRIIYSYANCGQVFCDTTTNDGGWIIFQRRIFGDVSFNRTWAEYQRGFGTYCTDYWLGLETISLFTNRHYYELRIDMQKGKNVHYAVYNTFKVGTYRDNYRLTIDYYSGNAGNDFVTHSNAMFSTKDKDNDASESNCAEFFNSGWWFTDCFTDNLNGDLKNSDWGMGVIWAPLMPDFNGSLDWVEMKMRRK